MNRPAPLLLRASARRRAERGSAYILALFSLASFTLLGLSLGLVTQTELILGANERTLERVFYTAESGVAIAAARTLVSNDQQKATVVFGDAPDDRSGLRVQDEVEISHMFPILATTCNLCEVNNQGGYDNEAFQKVNHAVTVWSRRRGKPADALVRVATEQDPGDGDVLAQKSVSAMLEMQPWKTSIDAIRPMHTDPDALSRIRF